MFCASACLLGSSCFSLYLVCCADYVVVVVVVMSNFVVVDAEAAFVVANLAGVAFLLWMPPLEK